MICQGCLEVRFSYWNDDLLRAAWGPVPLGGVAIAVYLAPKKGNLANMAANVLTESKL